MRAMLDVRVNGRVPDHLTSPDAADEVFRWRDNPQVTISDAAAVTLASWWQSPGTVGRYLAQLASTGRVNVPDLLADIDATRREAESREVFDDADALGLSALEAWAVHHPRREKWLTYRPDFSPGAPSRPGTGSALIVREPGRGACRRYEFDYDDRNIYVYCATFRDGAGWHGYGFGAYAPVRVIPRLRA